LFRKKRKNKKNAKKQEKSHKTCQKKTQKTQKKHKKTHKNANGVPFPKIPLKTAIFTASRAFVRNADKASTKANKTAIHGTLPNVGCHEKRPSRSPLNMSITVTRRASSERQLRSLVSMHPAKLKERGVMFSCTCRKTYSQRQQR
jgi:hypothetical protein